MKIKPYYSDKSLSFDRFTDTSHAIKPKTCTKLNCSNTFLNQAFCRLFRFFVIFYSDYFQTHDRRMINA